MKSSSVIKKRNSGIELLRIILILCVILMHYIERGGGQYNNVGFNYDCLLFIECACVGAVDAFILISGYYLCKTSKRTLIKPLKLLLMVAIIRVAHYVLTSLRSGNVIDVSVLLPMLIPHNWFLILYIALYFISPLFNVVFKYLTKTLVKRFLLVAIILFSVWTTSWDTFLNAFSLDTNWMSTIGMYGDQRGYNIVNFCLMYCIGAYIRIYGIENKYSATKLILVVILLIFAIFGWSLIYKIFTGRVVQIPRYYCSPLVILLATSVFLLFAKKSFHSAIINCLSRATFMVFITHEYFFTFLPIDMITALNPILMILIIICMACVLYLAGFIVYVLYSIVEIPLFKMLCKLCPCLSKDIYYNE